MGCVFQTQAGASLPRTLLKRTGAKKVRLSFGSKDATRFGTGDKHLSFLENIPTLEGGKTKVR
jgi:hypothetical protein